MVLSQKFRFYFVFYVVVLSTFGLSLACYNVVLFLDLKDQKLLKCFFLKKPQVERNYVTFN